MNCIGHERQKDLLKKMILSDKIPHNLLFTGPDSIGKRKIAIELVKLLNCDEGGCGKCDVCMEVEKDKHSDLLMIREEEITIEIIRDIQKKLSLTGRKKDSSKVIIIDRAHLMNYQAQACLLKTLEEPKGKALIILITEHPGILLDTILSRSWEVKFFPVADELIRKELSKRGATEKEAEVISKMSLSKPGLAFRFFEEDDFKKKWNEKEADLTKIRKNGFSERFDYVKKMSEDKREAKETLKIWAAIMRKEMIEAESESVARKRKKALEIIQKVLFLTTKTNINLKLSLERVVINL